MEIKYIKDPVKFLIDSGLLFEINRSVLHQFGLAMSVTLNEEGVDSEKGVIKIWDDRDDKEGILFGEEAFIDGFSKFGKFLADFGMGKINERREEVGYVIQTFPNPYLVRDGVSLYTYHPDYTPKDPASPKIILFTVPYQWINVQVAEWFDQSVDLFLMDYTHDSAELLYYEAKNAGVILSEEAIEEGLIEPEVE